MVEQSIGQINAALLVIGDEILSGRTRDCNIQYIAAHCTQIGINLAQVRVVSDDVDLIVHHVKELKNTYDYLFTTGGIGPTHDDVTALSIARVFDLPLELNEEAIKLMEARYPAGEFTKARQSMALIPKGATLIENTISSAPGFMTGNVITMAGVPDIMQVMLDAVTPKLRTGLKTHSQSVTVFHPESYVAEILANLVKDQSLVSLGSYPYFSQGQIGTQIVLRSTDQEAMDVLQKRLLDQLEEGSLTYQAS